MKKIGVMGGTFDPVHVGHTGLAEDALAQADLDMVLFMPAKLQPFKLDKDVTEEEHRINMLRLATKGHPGFSVSLLEMRLPGVSYTFRTMREVRKTLSPDDKLYFITGTDTFVKMHLWTHSEDLLRESAIIVGERPDYESAGLSEAIRTYGFLYDTEVIVIHNHKVDVSSTEIRRKIRKGESIRGIVDPQVEAYIYEHGLYQTEGAAEAGRAEAVR